METNKGPELTLHPEQKEEEVVQAQPVQDLARIFPLIINNLMRLKFSRFMTFPNRLILPIIQ